MSAPPEIPSFEELRQEALRRLQDRGLDLGVPEDVKSLIHELQTHQVELEVQNEHLRQTTRALAEARRKYQLLYEHTPVGYLTLDADGKIQRANIAAGRLCQKARREMMGMRLELLAAPAYRDECYRMLRRCSADKKRHRCQVQLDGPDPAPWVCLETDALVDANPENPGGYLVNMLEISERIQAVEKYQRQAERLTLALEGGRIGLWEYDLAGGGMYWGDVLYQLLGRDPDEEVTQETFFEYIHPDDRDRVRQAGKRWMSEGGEFRDEFRVVCAEGRVRWFAAVGKRIEDDSGKAISAIGVNFDITQSKQTADELGQKVRQRTIELERMVDRLEEEIDRRALAEEVLHDRTERLQETNRKLKHRTHLLQALSRRLSTAEDRERQRLADMLHDQMQQVLVGARFHLETAAGRTEDRQILDRIHSAHELLGEAIDKSRLLSHELSPPLLSEQGLGPALRWLVGQMDQIHDLQVEASVEEDFQDLSVFVAGLLYRGIRELLFNVVKHAGVRKARLEVTRKNDQIQAVVSDEGQGCEDLVPENFGRGLQHLAERTDAAGGSLDVVTATGDGCRVTIRIPLAALEHMTGQEVQ